MKQLKNTFEFDQFFEDIFVICIEIFKSKWPLKFSKRPV